MSNDKTLATVKHGGCVQLGDGPKNGEVYVEVSGLTGSGKSAIAGEVEILCKALGLDAEWVNGDEEKRLTHADWIGALEMYKPKVVIVERNVSRSPDARHQACESSLAAAARAAIPFVAYAFSEGVTGAEEAGRAIEAALSAQPSPGGKDALELLARFLQEPMHDLDMDHEISLSTARDAITFALAARQPVSAEDWSRSMAKKEAGQYVGAGAHGIPDEPAARQPVGEPVAYIEHFADRLSRVEMTMHGLQLGIGKHAAYAAPPAQQHGEPVAWMTHHDEPMLFPTAAEAAAYCEDDEQPVPLFRSPAQAVDLGPPIPSELTPVVAALKRFDECAEDCGSEGCDIGRTWFDALTTMGLLKRTQRSPAVWTMTAEGERLLALFDSQAVGNG